MNSQIVELSGEHPSLPAADVLGCRRALGADLAHVVHEPRLVVYRPSVNPHQMASRLALSRFVGETLLSGSLGEVREAAGQINLQDRSFRLRVEDFTRRYDSRSLEVSVGRVLASTGRVDLEEPEVDLRLVISRKAYLYRVDASVDRSSFESRKAERRPVFRPISLHPKFARALVNLTGVSRGESLLDPFCGTGGILLEAALVGAKATGSDLREEVLEGCRENLDFFGLMADLRACDVAEINQEIGEFDAIATDPPYGRSAGTMGEDPPVLMDRAFEAFQAALKSGGRLAICLPELNYLDIGRRYLKLLEYHSLPVHKSLIRHFSVFERV